MGIIPKRPRKDLVFIIILKYGKRSIIRKLKNDYTGKQFGKLYVEEMLPRYSGNRTYCKCKCACGNEKIIRLDGLLKEWTVEKSCGCISSHATPNIKERIDLTGNVYGDLTVVEMLYAYGKHGESYCRCICSLGGSCLWR